VGSCRKQLDTLCSYNDGVIQYLYLGRVAYDEGLRLQQELVALRTAGHIGNVLLLLEHPPVLTLGRNATRANILVSDEMLAARGVTVHEINRGGDVTYHGPGQLVGYPIFDLRSFANLKAADHNGGALSSTTNNGRFGPVDFVRRMEEALIRLCGVYGVAAGRIDGLTGVWCGIACSHSLEEGNGWKGERKIGAIGIHVSRGITSHGFAFNVTTDLNAFRLINPCGITDRPVTSLVHEVAETDSLPGLEAIAHEAARQFGLVFKQQVLAVATLDALRKQAATASSVPEGEPAVHKAQLAPTPLPQDTPLQIPPAVEHLHGLGRAPGERPVRS
jgi:lipoyl(octanoyl) transferase